MMRHSPTPLACAVLLFLANRSAAHPADTPGATPPPESSVAAQTAPEPKETEPVRVHEEVTVTASKTPQQPRDVTQTVRVLDEQQLSELPAPPNRNITELLSYQPGVFVSALSRNDANWGSNGGLGPKYSSYLLDGVPIDSFIDGMGLDPAAFQRVEIQRGPAAVMYSNYLGMDFAGNQTPLAGITNYVLRDRVDTPLTRIQAGFGSWNTANVQAYSQGRSGDLHYLVGGNWERSDYTNYGTPGSWLNILDDPQYTKVRLYGKGTVFLGEDQSISLFAHYYGHTGDVGRPNRDYDNSYGTINGAYKGRINDALDLQLRGGARLYGRRWGEDLYPASLALREHDGVEQTVFPVDLTLGWRQSGETRLTFGADGQYATYKTYAEADGPRTTGNDATASSIGLFAQQQVVLANVVLRGGLRYGHSSQSYSLLAGVEPGLKDRSWDKVLWSAGARWNLGAVSLFANSGSSFVAPTPKAVGGTLAPGDLGVPGRNGQLPNPDLQPESGIGSDVGFDLHLGELRLGARGFLNRVDDAIVDNVVSQNPSQTRSVNAGNATSYGVEATLDQAVGKSLTWFANGTYTHSRIENPLDADQQGAQVPFVPDWMGNVGASLSLHRRITVSPYLRAVGTYYDSTSLAGRQSFGGYVIPALRLQAVAAAGARSDVVFALDLNNLADNRYSMPWQFRDPGFSVFGTVAVRIR
ncbi:MAG TPA: TonB-dependent receptor [Vicinamibacteria bacterium]|nr:TonB-dependent receptor [Vicinamibacteria bacterium]